VEKYSKAQGRTAVSFNQTDLVCCRTLQGHSGKVGHWFDFGFLPQNCGAAFASSLSVRVVTWELNLEVLEPSEVSHLLLQLWKLILDGGSVSNSSLITIHGEEDWVTESTS
jgi:hypothetical protein